jgi:hypothetical protein
VRIKIWSTVVVVGGKSEEGIAGVARGERDRHGHGHFYLIFNLEQSTIIIDSLILINTSYHLKRVFLRNVTPQRVCIYKYIFEI